MFLIERLAKYSRANSRGVRDETVRPEEGLSKEQIGKRGGTGFKPTIPDRGVLVPSLKWFMHNDHYLDKTFYATLDEAYVQQVCSTANSPGFSIEVPDGAKGRRPRLAVLDYTLFNQCGWHSGRYRFQKQGDTFLLGHWQTLPSLSHKHKNSVWRAVERLFLANRLLEESYLRNYKLINSHLYQQGFEGELCARNDLKHVPWLFVTTGKQINWHQRSWLPSVPLVGDYRHHNLNVARALGDRRFFDYRNQNVLNLYSAVSRDRNELGLPIPDFAVNIPLWFKKSKEEKWHGLTNWLLPNGWLSPFRYLHDLELNAFGLYFNVDGEANTWGQMGRKAVKSGDSLVATVLPEVKGTKEVSRQYSTRTTFKWREFIHSVRAINRPLHNVLWQPATTLGKITGQQHAISFLSIRSWLPVMDNVESLPKRWLTWFVGLLVSTVLRTLLVRLIKQETVSNSLIASLAGSSKEGFNRIVTMFGAHTTSCNDALEYHSMQGYAGSLSNFVKDPFKVDDCKERRFATDQSYNFLREMSDRGLLNAVDIKQANDRGASRQRIIEGTDWDRRVYRDYYAMREWTLLKDPLAEAVTPHKNPYGLGNKRFGLRVVNKHSWNQFKGQGKFLDANAAEECLKDRLKKTSENHPLVFTLPGGSLPWGDKWKEKFNQDTSTMQYFVSHNTVLPSRVTDPNSFLPLLFFDSLGPEMPSFLYKIKQENAPAPSDESRRARRSRYPLMYSYQSKRSVEASFVNETNKILRQLVVNEDGITQRQEAGGLIGGTGTGDSLIDHTETTVTIKPLGNSKLSLEGKREALFSTEPQPGRCLTDDQDRPIMPKTWVRLPASAEAHGRDVGIRYNAFNHQRHALGVKFKHDLNKLLSLRMELNTNARSVDFMSIPIGNSFFGSLDHQHSKAMFYHSLLPFSLLPHNKWFNWVWRCFSTSKHFYNSRDILDIIGPLGSIIILDDKLMVKVQGEINSVFQDAIRNASDDRALQLSTDWIAIKTEMDNLKTSSAAFADEGTDADSDEDGQLALSGKLITSLFKSCAFVIWLAFRGLTRGVLLKALPRLTKLIVKEKLRNVHLFNSFFNQLLISISGSSSLVLKTSYLFRGHPNLEMAVLVITAICSQDPQGFSRSDGSLQDITLAQVQLDRTLFYRGRETTTTEDSGGAREHSLESYDELDLPAEGGTRVAQERKLTLRGPHEVKDIKDNSDSHVVGAMKKVSDWWTNRHP